MYKTEALRFSFQIINTNLNINMETQTKQNINNILNESLNSINKRWSEEDKINKEIRKTKKGLFLLYNNGLGFKSIICPYYSVEYIRELKKFSYGSRTYKERKPLTEEQHKTYFKIIDKQKKLNKQLEMFKDSL